MNYDLSYDYVAVIIMVILLIIYRGKRKAPLPIYKVNYVLSYTILTTAVLDIVSVWVLRHPGRFSINSIYLVNVLYLLAQNLVFVVYAIYELYVSSVDVKKSPVWKLLLCIPYGIAALLIVTTPYTEWIFYIDESGVYHHADGFLALYGLMGYYGIICITIMVKYRKVLKKYKIAYMCGVYALACFAQIIQILVPSVLLVTFACALSMIILLYAVQTPDEIFDGTNAMYRTYFVQGVSADYTSGKSAKVLFLYLHDYEIINESFGEEEVNRLLRGMCGYLHSLHPESLMYRVDESTYAYKIPGISQAEMDALTAMIMERFKDPWSNGFMDVVLPVSFVQVSYPEDVKSMEEFTRFLSILPKATMEVNVLLDPRDFAGEDENQEILEIVKKAVEEDRFEVHYQPIYSISEKKVIAAEALVRLYDERLGYISPERFVPLAEKEGYILKIGKYVFDEVCRFYSKNRLQEIGIEYIEVNLSAVQCMQYQLAEEFIDIMKAYNINPRRVNFEITETSAMISNPAVSLNISRFQNHGIALSLDDYGTGYSNISYLYHMPFRFIKIDKSILWSAEKNDKADITLQNIFQMAKKLHLKIVMEGVETQFQVRKLINMGCDYLQGYFFSKPVKGEEFIGYVKGFRLPPVCEESKKV